MVGKRTISFVLSIFGSSFVKASRRTWPGASSRHTKERRYRDTWVDIMRLSRPYMMDARGNILMGAVV